MHADGELAGGEAVLLSVAADCWNIDPFDSYRILAAGAALAAAGASRAWRLAAALRSRDRLPMPLDPVIFFFLLGLSAGILRSDLKIPGVLYESLSIFLLLAIGLKGGVELAKHPVAASLRFAGGRRRRCCRDHPAGSVWRVAPHRPFPRSDSAAIAAHYGSVSVVTFAVAATYLAARGESAEGYMVAFLVLLEFPALVIGVLLCPWRGEWHAMGTRSA